jgi:hypothetical protein
VKFSRLVQLIILWFISHGTAHAEIETIAGTRIKMAKPAGFEKAQTFAGFQKPDAGAAIMIMEIPAPYAAASAGFNEAKMSERGMKLLSKVERKVDKYDGQLLEISQTVNGIPFHKWVLVFGDDRFAQIITATLPEGQAKLLGEPMKQAVMSTTFDANAAAPKDQHDLNFELSDVPGLKLATRIQNALLFNPSGELPKEKLAYTPTSFLAAQSFSIGKLEIGDRAEYARQRLRQSPEIKVLELLEDNDVSLSKLPGREILATAKSKINEDLFVYQVMIFADDRYYIMRGDCLLSNRKEMEPIFRAATKTFKVK